MDGFRASWYTVWPFDRPTSALGGPRRGDGRSDTRKPMRNASFLTTHDLAICGLAQRYAVGFYLAIRFGCAARSWLAPNAVIKNGNPDGFERTSVGRLDIVSGW